MKKIKSFFWTIKHALTTCSVCHGMGTREMPNGETKVCNICNGKGYL